jgi:integrase
MRGLRRGELMALRWDDVDLAVGLIRVERSWDEKSGVYVTPKSASGVRSVPLVRLLREQLIEHRLRSGRAGGLVFEITSRSSRSASRACSSGKSLTKEAAQGSPLPFSSSRQPRAVISATLPLISASGMRAKLMAAWTGII